MKNEDLVEQAVRRFRMVSDSESNQRQREMDDLRFQVPDLQWDPIAREQRAGGLVQGTSFPLPARPTLSIPKLDQPIQLVTNQQRNAHLGVNIHPLSENANKETAEVIQGLYRKIERDSRADIARSWAFDRAVKAGRGAYSIDVRYDDWAAHPFDLSIFIDRILDQSNVYFDPTAEQPDWSDGKWAFRTRWLSLDEYKMEYDKSEMASVSEMEWSNAFQSAPQWTQGAGPGRAVLVAQYWCRESVTSEVVLHSNGNVYPSDKVPAGKTVMTRTRTDYKVKWHLVNGREVIDSGDWLGRYIPLIPVIGRELQPFDSDRRWSGIIGPAKDGQRLYNYAASAAVELVALEPRAPFVGDPRQFEGYEAWWQQANTRNFPYLPYNASVEGMADVLPPPQRVQVDANRMGPTMLLLQQADEFIQSATGIHDPSLGKLDPSNRSGKAILALQSQSDAGSNMYLMNLGDISMTFEAKQILDLMPKVYKRAGRMAEIIDGEDQTRTVMFNTPYQPGKDGRPQRIPMDREMPKNYKMYDLTTGVYGVSVQVGKSYQTRLQQGSDEIGQILQASPEMMPLIGATYFRFRDFPGAPEIADILKVVRDKQYPGVSMSKDEQPSADELRAKLAAAEQQMQQMQQALQQAGMEIQTDQAKQQATLQKAQLDAQVKAQSSQADNAVKLEIAKLDAQTKLAIAELTAGQQAQANQMSLMLGLLTAREKMAEERRLDDEQGAHEVGMEAMKAAHAERQMQMAGEEAEAQRGHDAGIGAGQARMQSEESERGREHEAEQAERDRALSQADGDAE